MLMANELCGFGVGASGLEKGWTAVAGALSGICYGAAWSPTLKIWVAVSWSGTNKFAYSRDGLVWTKYAAPDEGGEWYDIVWSTTLSKFIAHTRVQVSGKNVAISSDGLTWTLAAAPALDIRGRMGVMGSTDKFLLLGTNGQGTTAIATSTDGTTWSQPTLPLNTGWLCSAWSPSLGRAVIFGEYNALMTTSDGVTFTDRSSNLPATTDQQVHGGVAWSPALGVFAAVRDPSTYTGTGIITSSDGITWTARSTPSGLYGWGHIVWSPGLSKFVATARASGVSPYYHVMTSPDGINWTARPSAVTDGAGVATQFLRVGVGASDSGGDRLLSGRSGTIFVSDDAGI